MVQMRLVASPIERGLAKRFRTQRVGLRGVLADLGRIARPTEVPGAAADAGFAWDHHDQVSRRWYPQGVTTAADADARGDFDGRSVAIVSWYARGLIGRLFLGSRITVVADIDAKEPRYEHVLLMAPRRILGIPLLRPVRVHAGGIAWYGEHLFVTSSARGIDVFRLNEIARVRRRWRTYRYVLPRFAEYRAENDRDAVPVTYSFLSLDRGLEHDHLVAGEYARQGGRPRLMRYRLDRESQMLRIGDERAAIPVEVFERQVPRMQGAAVMHGTWFVTASAGEGSPGDLWVGRPGALVRHRGVLPTGPEDISFWPHRGQLWTVTEWPGRRWVYPIDAERWAS